MDKLRWFLIISCLSIPSIVFSQKIENVCAFNPAKICTLQRDILNDKTLDGLSYYASTNLDNRITGEINIYKSNLATLDTTTPHTAGQLKLTLNNIHGYYYSGEIRTRADLTHAPYNSPVSSAPWTTKELSHGYLEIIVKMPKCDRSRDLLCQNMTPPIEYSSGLWPKIALLPTNDSNWPQNGDIRLAEAYWAGHGFNLSTASLHFNGNDNKCQGNDCKYQGFILSQKTLTEPLYTNTHTWGFEWQPDLETSNGGQFLTGYLDNQIIWGPLKTADLPQEAMNALTRGFNDPNGGYYLVINLATGGAFAGLPNPHLTQADFIVESVKAYEVTTPDKICQPPVNPSCWRYNSASTSCQWWAPENSDTILGYQIFDKTSQLVWQGGATRTIDDFMCNGQPFTFYTMCLNSVSSPVVVPIDDPLCNDLRKN
jgi:hypothetical protein